VTGGRWVSSEPREDVVWLQCDNLKMVADPLAYPNAPLTDPFLEGSRILLITQRISQGTVMT
jgi:hypothetical protein